MQFVDEGLCSAPIECSSQAAPFWGIIHSPSFSHNKDALVAPFALCWDSSRFYSVSSHNMDQVVENNVK